MNRTLVKKMIKNMKDGTIYGIFNRANDTETFWTMLYSMGKICVSHYGSYSMSCTIDNLLDRFTWESNKRIYMKPVRWHEKKVRYVAV